MSANRQITNYLLCKICRSGFSDVIKVQSPILYIQMPLFNINIGLLGLFFSHHNLKPTLFKWILILGSWLQAQIVYRHLISSAFCFIPGNGLIKAQSPINPMKPTTMGSTLVAVSAAAGSNVGSSGPVDLALVADLIATVMRLATDTLKDMVDD